MEIKLTVNGMHCMHCEKKVETAVKELNGVNEAKANHEESSLTLQVNEDYNIKDIKKAIKKCGFKVK